MARSAKEPSMILVGRVSNGTVAIAVIDDMGETSETFPEKRVAIEMTEKRIGLNRSELEQHIQHCTAALELFSD
jgi:hypothetical protein